ncbi:hypothetical protein I5L01_12200 [Erythrobacter sp. YJ-T3-07]|uniref:hypothetical protein n=1 Tax=Erythrobacter sp. YJ-T3-07 TaxID=2793063 RepID=UPI0018D45175|nr:hypothetical protein [Erythrobacter sp. YJ-T3-07]MBH1944982.1 hypothetical protein [Erythrobacter sp. YJ-T3-07]
MGTSKKTNPKQPVAKSDAGGSSKDPGKSDESSLADVALDPAAHALCLAEPFNRGSFGKRGTTESYSVLLEHIEAAKAGDLSHYRAMLASQAISLDSMFLELSRRAACNMGEYLGATETYIRLALKAQAQSRATIEALDRLANGRVQTVKHVHVNDGGQAVIADRVHNHAGGLRNAKSDNQSHATATEAVGSGPALLSADPCGNGVPITSGERKEALPNARRDKPRRTKG